MNTIEQKCLASLAQSRLYIKRHGPYFSSIIYGLIPRMVPDLSSVAGGPIGVSKGMVMAIDPEWFVDGVHDLVKEQNANPITANVIKMQAGIQVHEAMHILRGMHRLDALPNHELANMAGDIAINHDLLNAKLADGSPMWLLPHWALVPETFGFPTGLILEAYYKLLEKKGKGKGKNKGKGKGSSKKKDEDKEGGSSNGKGKGDDKGKGKGKGKGEGKDSKSKDGKGSSGQSPSIASGKCGGCAGNPLGHALEKKLDAEVGRTKADKERIRKQAISEIKQAMEGAGRGSMPTSLQELVELDNQVSITPWRQILSQIVRRAFGKAVAGHTDYSIKRPSKRSQPRGMIRPGLIDRKPEIAIIEDSSGSMGKQQIKDSRVEALKIMKDFGVDSVWFLDADADVAAPPKRITVRDLVDLPVIGRGGTCFAPALQAVQELRPRPVICIYLTDGDGTAPKNPPPNMEVVWCIVPSPYGRRPAQWGHLVVLSDDQKLREPYNF